MSFYHMQGLPRVELKYQAKDLLRGNWPVLILVTLIYLFLTGLFVTYKDGDVTPQTVGWCRQTMRTMYLIM